MASLKIFVALLAISSSVVVGAPGEKAQDGKINKNAAEVPLNQDSKAAANVTEGLPDKQTEAPKAIATPTEARSSPEAPREAEKEDEHKMSPGQIIELARKRNDELEHEQKLVNQKLVGRDILKEEPRFNGIKSTEDLIKYIVSLVVPDVLKALLPQKVEGLEFLKGASLSRSQHEPLLQDGAPGERVDAEPLEEQQKPARPFGGLARRPQPTKLRSKADDAQPEEPAAQQGDKEGPLRLAPRKKTKNAGASSKRRNNQAQAIDAQTLDLAVQLLRSLKGADGLEALTAAGKTSGTAASSINEDVKGRRARRKESRKVESKVSSQQVTRDSFDAASKQSDNELSALSASRSAKQWW